MINSSVASAVEECCVLVESLTMASAVLTPSVWSLGHGCCSGRKMDHIFIPDNGTPLEAKHIQALFRYLRFCGSAGMLCEYGRSSPLLHPLDDRK
jgi:hypothetical protein